LRMTNISPLRGLGVFWWDAFYKDGAPTALGLWGKWFGDDGAHARIAQIEHRRCDISVAARAEQHPQSSVRSGIVEDLGCLLAMLGFTEIPPLRGWICYWWHGFYRDFAPKRGLGFFWWGGFYRDGAPTALGVWGKRFGDHRDFAPDGAWGVGETV
jgi:hypothetical protein